MKFFCLRVFLIMAFQCVSLFGEELSLQPKYFNAGAYSSDTIDGVSAWVPNNNERMLYFDVPSSFRFGTNPVYVKIDYYDAGRGRLVVQYDSATTNSYQLAEIHTRSSRVGSGQWVTSYQVFELPLLANRQNGATDFRMRLVGEMGPPLQVSAVTISTEPFADARLQFILSEPWLQPYTGEVRDWVDAKGLRGKVMTGYQGWFRAPNDLVDNGWNHWGRSKETDPSPTEITIDMWPWMDHYRAEDIYRAGEMVLGDGRPAYLFSSNDLDTVRTHFRWMRQYHIDGVYLQRFVTRNNSGYYGAREFVLHNVRQAAREEGRVWAIEYDVSSLDSDPDPFTVIKNDWQWLVNEAEILDDPRYLYENGKPVLFIWGFSVNGRDFTLAQANQIVDWFGTQNLHLIGGVPSNWENMTDWHGHYQRYDQLLGWMSKSQSELNSERQLLESWGMKLLPHAWPGFSWSNLKKQPGDQQYTARRRGSFYWERLWESINSGADQIFLGMFDEYDEGTAIMPMSDNPPQPHTAWGQYIDNAGREPFWWLRLSGYANEMLDGARPIDSNEPLESQVHDRIYAGPDATLFPGSTLAGDRLSMVYYDDGDSQQATYGDQACRVSVDSPDAAQYLYFDIDNSFLADNGNPAMVLVEAEVYAPESNTSVKLQYNSTSSDYALASLAATPLHSAWVTLRWFLSDAAFASRQNAGADFRLNIGKGKALAVRRVSVFLPEPKPAPADHTVQLNISEDQLHWSEQLDATGWRLYRSSDLGNGNWFPVNDNSISFNPDRSVSHTIPWNTNPQFFRLQRAP